MNCATAVEESDATSCLDHRAGRGARPDCRCVRQWPKRTGPIVESRHEDSPDREYVIEARARSGEVPFLSETLRPGNTLQVDFSQRDLDVLPYRATLGLTRVPGTIDTRPGAVASSARTDQAAPEQVIIAR